MTHSEQLVYAQKLVIEKSGLKRILLYAGPGAGKSTMAHFLTFKLKSVGVTAELAREWIKRWAYERKDIKRDMDLPLVFGRQVAEEVQFLQANALIVSDSPLVLQNAYIDGKTQRWLRGALYEQEYILDQMYPTMHIRLIRDDRRDYNPNGRWQSSIEAHKKDLQIRDTMIEFSLPYTEAKAHDYEDLWLQVLTFCKDKIYSDGAYQNG